MSFNSEQKTSRLETMLVRLKQGVTRSQVLGLFLISALLLAPALSHGEVADDSYSVVMSWNHNSDPAIAGYRIYYGTASGNYSQNITLGNTTSVTIMGLTGGITYYFAVTAYNIEGLESAFSDEIVYVPGLATVALRSAPGQPFVLTVSGLNNHNYDVQATTDFLLWSVIGTVTTGPAGWIEFTDTNTALFPVRFYRTQSAP